MKKLVCLLILISFVLSLAVFSFAQDREAIQSEIAKIKKEMVRLEDKLQGAKEFKRIDFIKNMLRNHRERIASLQKELGPVQEIVRPMPSRSPAVAPATPPGPPPSFAERPRPSGTVSAPQLEFGISGGMIAGITGAVGEVKFNNPFDLVATSLRIGVGYAQGTNKNSATFKSIPVSIDGIYRLNPPGAPGMKSYFGLGANYVAYNSSAAQGTLGGQVFFGLEGEAAQGKVYAEAGYGMLRNSTSDSTNNFTGAGIVVGYRLPASAFMF
jgi:hypothetical protein